MDLTAIVAANMKKMRESNGLSQKTVADTLGITQGMLSKYENGRGRPPYEVLLNFADFFGVTVDCLLRTTVTNLGNGMDDLPADIRIALLWLIRRYRQGKQG